MKLYSLKTNTKKASMAATTVVELLVTVMLSSIVFAALALLWTNGARGILAMTNYTELDRRSKTALDIMSKDIRQASAMTSFATNKIDITLTDNSGVKYTNTYTYDSSAKTLTRTSKGASKVLLTQCDRLSFGISQQNPTANFTFAPAGSVSVAKLVDVNWKCSRQILGKSINTESIQTAKIVMRN